MSPSAKEVPVSVAEDDSGSELSLIDSQGYDQVAGRRWARAAYRREEEELRERLETALLWNREYNGIEMQ